MGNLNSRETSQLLDSAEFKHVCKNLGDFFGSHGEYMQHRRRRSRKEGSHREETNRQESKDRGREKSRGLKPELVKNLDWQCPGGGGCPWYKLVTELLRRNPPNARESRRNISQDHPYNERRHSTPYPPQPQRESYPRDTRTRPLPTPQNGTLHPLLLKSHPLTKLTNVSLETQIPQTGPVLTVILININRTHTFPRAMIPTSPGPCPGPAPITVQDPMSPESQTSETFNPHTLEPPPLPPQPPPPFPHPSLAITARRPQDAQPGLGFGSARCRLLR